MRMSRRWDCERKARAVAATEASDEKSLSRNVSGVVGWLVLSSAVRASARVEDRPVK
jgi:hypothetical protein